MPRKMLSATTQAPRADGAIQVEVTLPTRQRCRDTRARPCPDAHTDSPTRIPRISRLMALAIKFQGMVDRNEVRDYSDLAGLGYVTRARVTQIMNLLMLAPNIQERLLSPDERIFGVRERSLRGICAQVEWITQRRLWTALLNGASDEPTI